MLSQGSEPEGEEGFTLVELLLAVTILGIIVGAIVASIFVMLSTRQKASAQLENSHDRQQLASYFTQDVEGASGASAFSSGATTICGQAVTSFLTISGQDYDPPSITPIPTVVAYVYTLEAGSHDVTDAAQDSVTRISCRNGTTMVRSIVARAVSATPSVAGSCTTTPAPALTGTSTSVALTVPENGGPSVVLCARRRAS